MIILSLFSFKMIKICIKIDGLLDELFIKALLKEMQTVVNAMVVWDEDDYHDVQQQVEEVAVEDCFSYHTLHIGIDMLIVLQYLSTEPFQMVRSISCTHCKSFLMDSASAMTVV